MSRRAERQRIAPGIYRDSANWTATIHVRGAGFRERRFPLAVPIEQVQRWRNDTRVSLLGAAERGSQPGTFARDAVTYLTAFTGHLVSAKARKIEITAWVAIFGSRARGTLKPADVAKTRSLWLSQGLAPKTINNRTASLRHLYHAMDGRRAWTPVDELRPLDVPRTPIQRVDDALILRVDANLQAHERDKFLRDAKTRARFRVLVSTGRRPSELMRAEPGDVDMARRIWVVRDGKGGYSPGLYLNNDMLAAWQTFLDADAWGPYNTNAFVRVLRTAGWPADVRPYQARHTLGMSLSEGGTDLDDIGAVMGHTRRETTRQHYVPVLHSRMQRASESLDGRFGGWTQAAATRSPATRGVQTGVQTGHTQIDRNRNKSTGRPRAPATTRSGETGQKRRKN